MELKAFPPPPRLSRPGFTGRPDCVLLSILVPHVYLTLVHGPVLLFDSTRVASIRTGIFTGIEGVIANFTKHINR